MMAMQPGTGAMGGPAAMGGQHPGGQMGGMPAQMGGQSMAGGMPNAHALSHLTPQAQAMQQQQMMQQQQCKSLKSYFSAGYGRHLLGCSWRVNYTWTSTV